MPILLATDLIPSSVIYFYLVSSSEASGGMRLTAMMTNRQLASKQKKSVSWLNIKSIHVHIIILSLGQLSLKQNRSLYAKYVAFV